MSDDTFTFVVDKNATWQQCNGLYDITNSVKISIRTLPNGKTVISIDSDRISFAPKENFAVSENVEFGRTYQFEY